MSLDVRNKLAQEPEPAWEIAYLFPPQGEWSEEEYLSLQTNKLVEFVDGRIEVLPMPKTSHQFIVAYLYRALLAFVSHGQLGTVIFAALPIKLPPRTFREPDILFMLAENSDRIGEDFWDRADLVMEVVCDRNRRHDLVTKRLEYAQAGIPEYWIVDPREQSITVLTLAGDAYAVHGEFTSSQRAASKLLPGFEVEVTAVFEQGRRPAP